MPGRGQAECRMPEPVALLVAVGRFEPGGKVQQVSRLCCPIGNSRLIASQPQTIMPWLLGRPGTNKGARVRVWPLSPNALASELSRR